MPTGVHGGDLLTNVTELLSAPVDLNRPQLFTSVGMAWQELVVAAAAYRRIGSGDE